MRGKFFFRFHTSKRISIIFITDWSTPEYECFINFGYSDIDPSNTYEGIKGKECVEKCFQESKKDEKINGVSFGPGGNDLIDSKFSPYSP